MEINRNPREFEAELSLSCCFNFSFAVGAYSLLKILARDRMHLANKDPTTWLTGQLFQKALTQYTTDRGLEVEDVHLAVHGNAAQQYASTIYRACVSYRSRGKTESIKLIVKLVASKVNSLADELTFDTELKVYRDYLSKMETMLGDDAKAFKFGPK